MAISTGGLPVRRITREPYSSSLTFLRFLRKYKTHPDPDSCACRDEAPESMENKARRGQTGLTGLSTI